MQILKMLSSFIVILAKGEQAQVVVVYYCLADFIATFWTVQSTLELADSQTRKV